MPVRRVVIDHVSVGVLDLDRSRAFYTRALAPLGFKELGAWSDEAREVSFGVGNANDFAISFVYPPAPEVHIAFAAESREQVDAFHQAALAAGGRENGPPGPRERYSASYYAAYVLDPDANNIEAVFWEPEDDAAAVDLGDAGGWAGPTTG